MHYIYKKGIETIIFETDQKKSKHSNIKILTIHLDNIIYGIELSNVIEIINTKDILKKSLNLKNITIILNKNNIEEELNNRNYIIILKAKTDQKAIFADNIANIIEINKYNKNKEIEYNGTNLKIINLS